MHVVLRFGLLDLAWDGLVLFVANVVHPDCFVPTCDDFSANFLKALLFPNRFNEAFGFVELAHGDLEQSYQLACAVVSAHHFLLQRLGLQLVGQCGVKLSLEPQLVAEL